MMRKLITLCMAVLFSAGLFGQIDSVSIRDINAPIDLANCNDTSNYYLDTVSFVAYVVTDGSLCEVASGSITGANGIRPFIWMNDTANNGAVDSLSGLEVMGVNWSSSQATQGFTSLIEGDLVRVTGVVGMFSGATQFQPLNNNAITVLNSSFPTITPKVVPVSDLNDQNQINNIVDGHEWEGAFIEVQNVTVTNVNPFGSGTSSRVTFTVADGAGNSMEVYDFFLGQKLTTWPTLNPNSPQDSGSFTAPSVGTNFQYIRGVVEHQSNGCAGGTGAGYRIHPFKSSHYKVGASAPNITNVVVTPGVPTSNDSIVITADIVDADGSIDTAEIFWTTDPNLPSGSFTKASMNLVANNQYEYSISPQADGTNIRYYIRAVDNDTTVTLSPATPASQANPNFARIFVRDNGLSIPDIQTPFSGGSSPFEGQEATVTGFVTAGQQGCDLEFVYIQDSAATEWAGLALRGSLNLAALERNQKVQVTGQVVESFGFTQMNVNQVTPLQSSFEIQPVVLDPSDTAADLEKYESMLVSYQNAGGQVVISEADAGFGEYRVSTNASNDDEDNSRRILAGRQDGSRAQSSLHVSLISDSAYINSNGILAVAPVITQSGMTMDAITGPLWYAFGNYKLTPRNNFDIENLSTPLDTNGCNFPSFSIAEGFSQMDLNVYPNPARNILHVNAPVSNLQVTLYTINGTAVQKVSGQNGTVSMQLERLPQGVYVLKVNSDAQTIATRKIIVTH